MPVEYTEYVLLAEVDIANVGVFHSLSPALHATSSVSKLGIYLNILFNYEIIFFVFRFFFFIRCT